MTGSFSSNGPRTVLTLNGIYNGNLSNQTLSASSYTFAVYPYNGGAFALESDNGAGTTFGIASGNLYTQTASSLESSQGYGLNLSGVNGNGEVDSIAQTTTSNGTMTGLYDTNNLGYLVTGASLETGNYSTTSNGRGTASFPGLQMVNNSYISSLNFAYYVVDSSTAVFLETDSDQLSIGTLQLQQAGAAPSLLQASIATRPSSTMTPLLAAHGAFHAKR